MYKRQVLGVNPDEVYMTQPDYAEQALELLDMMVESGQFDLIIFDSVGGMVPKSELEGEMGDSKMGLHARLMSQGLRKLTPNISKKNCIVIFINQLREKIGVMFGNPETTTGGNALKFYASVRIRVSKKGKIEVGGQQVGHTMCINVVKNKTAPPMKKAESKFYYDGGVSIENEVLDLCIENDIVKKVGSWYSYKDTKLGQGETNVVSMLKDNPELFDELLQELEKLK